MAKLRVLAENPPPPRGDESNQLRELRDYLTRLKDELEFLLTHLGTDNLDTVMTGYVKQIQTQAGEIEDLNTALDGKQDTLIFDDSPTSGSGNPVTSGGVYTALGSKANHSQLAHVQTSNAADHAYKVGEHFCYAGNLYRTTAAVANGATLARGTNCEQVMVGDGLVAVRTATGTTNASGRVSTGLQIANALVLSATANGYFCSVYANNNVQGVEVRDLNGAAVANTSVTLELVVLYR